MRGWNWLHNATKWHYFVNNESLCGRWMMFGPNDDADDKNDDSPDNCKACQRKVKAMREKEAKDALA